ncbi:MAG: acetyltransferase [Fluviibacter sp.]
MQNLLLLGAGGHACVVADAALLQGVWSSVLASGTEHLPEGGELLPGVLKLNRALVSHWLKTSKLHVAIGDNSIRQKETLAVDSKCLVSVIHPLASISPYALIGVGSFIAANAVVAPRASLAEGVIVNHGAIVDHDCRIDSFAHIAPGASLGGAVRVGSGVLVGAGSRILPELIVCQGSVVGAGAVVVENILKPGIYVGVPARKIE